MVKINVFLQVHYKLRGGGVGQIQNFVEDRIFLRYWLN